ncbi:MAG: hypothetical protein RR513_06555 [Muribaculaceae bacterium]
MSFNTYGTKTKSYGVVTPIWLDIDGTKTGGGIITPTPAIGTLIPAGTAVNLDKIGGIITIYTGEVGAQECNGLLWHDVLMEEGDTSASGAVVDKGRVLASRIPALSIKPEVKAKLPNIIFEEE